MKPTTVSKSAGFDEYQYQLPANSFQLKNNPLQSHKASNFSTNDIASHVQPSTAPNIYISHLQSIPGQGNTANGARFSSFSETSAAFEPPLASNNRHTSNSHSSSSITVLPIGSEQPSTSNNGYAVSFQPSSTNTIVPSESSSSTDSSNPAQGISEITQNLPGITDEKSNRTNKGGLCVELEKEMIKYTEQSEDWKDCKHRLTKLLETNGITNEDQLKLRKKDIERVITSAVFAWEVMVEHHTFYCFKESKSNAIERLAQTNPVASHRLQTFIAEARRGVQTGNCT